MKHKKLVRDDFKVPFEKNAGSFRLRQLGVRDLALDYEAYMSSVDHLKGWHQPERKWPEGCTLEDALIDLGWCEQEARNRSGFTYAVLNPEETRELGCVYVYGTFKKGYDAQVNLWVRKDEYDKGFDEELFAFVKNWIAKEWPFKRVAYPKREIAWDEWSEMPDKD